VRKFRFRVSLCSHARILPM